MCSSVARAVVVPVPVAEERAAVGHAAPVRKGAVEYYASITPVSRRDKVLVVAQVMIGSASSY